MVDNEPKRPPVVFEDSAWNITLQPDRSAVIKFKVPGTIVRELEFNYADACDFLATFYEVIEKDAEGCAVSALAHYLGYPINVFFEWVAEGVARRELEVANV